MFCSCIARQMFSGLSGSLMIFTPSGASASSIALARTTGGPMAPISPTPLNPPG